MVSKVGEVGGGGGGVDLIKLSYLLYVFGKTGLSTTHPANVHTFTGSKMDLLKI